MKRKELQRALDAGGTVVIEGMVNIDRPLVVTKETRIEGGLLIGEADVVLLDYPLQVKPETSQTQRNDLQLYAKITDRKIVILSRFACCPSR